MDLGWSSRFTNTPPMVICGNLCEIRQASKYSSRNNSKTCTETTMVVHIAEAWWMSYNSFAISRIDLIFGLIVCFIHPTMRWLSAVQIFMVWWIGCRFRYIAVKKSEFLSWANSHMKFDDEWMIELLTGFFFASNREIKE